MEKIQSLQMSKKTYKSKKISKDSMITKIQLDNIEKTMKIKKKSKNQVKLEKGRNISQKQRKHSHIKEHLKKSQKAFKN